MLSIFFTSELSENVKRSKCETSIGSSLEAQSVRIFEETEVSGIPITSFVKKEYVEALTVKKNTQNHVQGMLEKVKVR